MGGSFNNSTTANGTTDATPASFISKVVGAVQDQDQTSSFFKKTNAFSFRRGFAKSYQRTEDEIENGLNFADIQKDLLHLGGAHGRGFKKCKKSAKKCHKAVHDLHALEDAHHVTEETVVKLLKDIYDHCGVVCEQCNDHWGKLEKVKAFELHAGDLENECKKYADFKDEMDHHDDKDWAEEEAMNPFSELEDHAYLLSSKS